MTKDEVRERYFAARNKAMVQWVELNPKALQAYEKEVEAHPDVIDSLLQAFPPADFPQAGISFIDNTDFPKTAIAFAFSYDCSPCASSRNGVPIG